MSVILAVQLRLGHKRPPVEAALRQLILVSATATHIRHGSLDTALRLHVLPVTFAD